MNKELTADEMFKKLGYKLIKHKSYCFYYKELEENCCNEMSVYHIEFDYRTKTVDKTFGDDNTVVAITMEELQAINKKVEELGWIK